MGAGTLNRIWDFARSKAVAIPAHAKGVHPMHWILVALMFSAVAFLLS